MKNKIHYALPFFCMFLLAAGSVVLSCVSTPNKIEGSKETLTTINTGPDTSGEIYTTWQLSKIKSVMIINMKDKSKKIELREDEWEYDSSTTRLILKKEIPFQDFAVHIEGLNKTPNTFVLKNFKNKEGFFVALEERLAIEGFDFSFDEQNNHLTFRDDIDLHNGTWLIRYNTPEGVSSFGEWKDGDWFSYLEADQRKKFLDSWYDSQDAFYFFEDVPERKNDPSIPPKLIKRTASPEELHQMKSYPVSVLKYRYQASDKELTKELGFKVSLPKTIPGKTGQESIPLSGKIIEELSADGKLVKKLQALYFSDEMFELTLLKNQGDLGRDNNPEDETYIISADTVDLGLPVFRTRNWGTGIKNLDDVPELISITSWEWKIGDVVYAVSSVSENEGWYESVILYLIKFYR